MSEIAYVGKKREVEPVLKRALGLFESRSEFSRQVGVSRQVVNYWIQRGCIPAHYALTVSHATQGKIAPLEVIHEANKVRQRARALKELRKAAEVSDGR